MITPSVERIRRGLWWERAWTLVEGCTPQTAGCANCWAAAQTYMRARQRNPKKQARYGGLTEKAEGCSARFNGKVRLMKDALDLPLRTKRPTVWAIWNDLLHPDVPFRFIYAAFVVMRQCPQHVFMLLTKRAERLGELSELGSDLSSLPHVCVGVSVEDQKTADERIRLLLQCPAAVRFVSCEPLLGNIDFTEWFWKYGRGCLRLDGSVDDTFDIATEELHWVIVGGETGPRARPMHPDWVRSIRDQCQEAGVPFFFKQWGEWGPGSYQGQAAVEALKEQAVALNPSEPNFYRFGMIRLGKKRAGRLLDGREWNEMPGGMKGIKDGTKDAEDLAVCSGERDG